MELALLMTSLQSDGSDTNAESLVNTSQIILNQMLYLSHCSPDGMLILLGWSCNKTWTQVETQMSQGMKYEV